MELHSKRSRITSVLLSMVLLMTILFSSFPLSVEAADSDFAGGTGTDRDPYIIQTAEQLEKVRGNLSSSFKLANDIDLTEYLADGGEGYAKWRTLGWQPIGDDSNPFTGSFDGANYKITGLWINRSGTNYVGLFGYSKGDIQNLGVEIDNDKGGVNGADYTGGLVGNIQSGSISDSYATGSVTGSSCTGGLVGFLTSSGSITSSYAIVSVSSTGNDTGGLVGYLTSYGSITSSYATGCVSSTGSDTGGLVGFLKSYGSITNSYATGSVTGSNKTGGLVGSLTSYGSITSSYATGSVTGIFFTGGLVGSSSHGSITSSYATGSVTGNSSTGGLVGSSDTGSSITNSYATGSVSSTGSSTGNSTGGLVGYSYGRITSSYFDKDATGQTDGVGNDSTATGVTGLTTAEMVASDTLSNAMSDLDDGNGTWSKRATTDSYCYYPELTVFYDHGELDTTQKQASELSVRVQRTLQTVGDITEPDTIYSGQSLTLTAPTVNSGTETITSQGWQIGLGGSTWTDFDPASTLTTSYGGYLLRYYATSDFGTAYSNEVEIMVQTPPPTIDPIDPA